MERQLHAPVHHRSGQQGLVDVVGRRHVRPRREGRGAEPAGVLVVARQVALVVMSPDVRQPVDRVAGRRRRLLVVGRRRQACCCREGRYGRRRLVVRPRAVAG